MLCCLEHFDGKQSVFFLRGEQRAQPAECELYLDHIKQWAIFIQALPLSVSGLFERLYIRLYFTYH